MNYLLISVIVVVVLILLYYIVKYMTTKRCRGRETRSEIILLNYNTHLYDSKTQKNIEELFFNLVLLREILDSGNADTKKTLVPSIVDSLSTTVAKIQPVLEIENEIVATVEGTTFKLKKDGMGNICFGSPVYFMCLNPRKKDLYPYINDMIVVYHLMRNRITGQRKRDADVEKLLDSILKNVFSCDAGDFSLDYNEKYDDLILTKLFNSKLDKEFTAALMMIILFANENKIIDTISMRNDGTFVLSDPTLSYLRKFTKKNLRNRLTYEDMKHTMYNLCYAKYTVHGFKTINTDSVKIQDRTELIDALMKTSLCTLKSILKTSESYGGAYGKEKKHVTFADDDEYEKYISA